MQKLSGTVRSFTVESVLPGKMVTGSKISPLAAMIRTATTCFIVVVVVVIFFTSKRWKNQISSICSERFCLNEVCLRSESPSLWIKFWSRPSLTRKIYIHVEFEFVKYWFINPIQDGPFQGCSRMRGGGGGGGVVGQKDPLSKMCSADISIFSPKMSKFCYIKKYRYRLRVVT